MILFLGRQTKGLFVLHSYFCAGKKLENRIYIKPFICKKKCWILIFGFPKKTKLDKTGKLSVRKNDHCHVYPVYLVMCTLCTLSCVPCVPCHVYPVYLVMCTLCTLSCVPCVPCHVYPVYLVMCTLCTLSCVPCVPCHVYPV